MERALAIAIDVGVPDDIGRAYHNATEILAICGRDERALELVHEGMGRARAMGMELTWGDFINLHGAVIAYGLGRWDEAARFIEAGLLEYPNPTPEIYALTRTVEFEVASGRWDAAAIQLARIGELVDGYEMEFQYTGPWSSARAELALWQKRPREAIAAVDDGLTRLERTEETRYRVRLLRYGTCAAAELAEIARDRRDPEAEAEARAVAGTLRARVAGAVAAVAEMDGGLALELTAELATTAAEETRLHGASDPAAWLQAADRWLARNRPYCRAYARWREAEALLAHGQRATATSALREAAETAAGLGAGPLMDAIAALARRARIPIAVPEPEAARPEPGPGDRAAAELGLTPREREVLELVAQGQTNRQIAAALYISVYTAGVHVSRILGKLGATSRTEAAAMAYRRGIAVPSAASDRGLT
jgi:DNA-binding CsgD family transcriptional regulator